MVAIHSLYYSLIIIIEVGYFTLKLQEALQSSFGLLNHLCQSSSIHRLNLNIFQTLHLNYSNIHSLKFQTPLF